MRVLRVHLCPTHGVHHHIRGLRSPVRSPGRRYQPVVVVGRHQHQLTTAVTGDLNGFASGCVLVFAEIALEFDGGCLRYGLAPSRSNVRVMRTMQITSSWDSKRAHPG